MELTKADVRDERVGSASLGRRHWRPPRTSSMCHCRIFPLMLPLASLPRGYLQGLPLPFATMSCAAPAYALPQIFAYRHPAGAS